MENNAIKDLVNRILKDMCIWAKDEYAKFTTILNRPKIKKKIFQRLANIEEDDEEEDL